MQQKFDAIIVGAGPAGCACAYRLAQAGLEVLLVERGKFAGAQNMWGGALCGPVLGELIPDFWEQAPYERYVASHKISLLSGDSCVTIDASDHQAAKPPYHEVTVLRSKFDRWLADRVQQAGAIVAVGLQADDLLKDGDRIVGIKAGGDELPAGVVIACDGVNSILAQKAGMRGELKPAQVKQGVKEVITLPRETIEQRFGLKGDAGVSWSFLGECTRGLPGGGFIYTNKDSLSVGVVVQLSALAEKQVRADELLDDFKKNPAVAPLLEGGETVEYSGHLIPAAGANMMPGLVTDGLLVAGDAAAFGVGTGLILEGANFAVASGIAAADTVIGVREKGDFSFCSLDHYRELLQHSFVMKDLKTFRHAPHFLENPRLYTTYPELAGNLAKRLFTSTGQPRQLAWRVLREEMGGKVSLWRVARDFMQGKKAL